MSRPRPVEPGVGLAAVDHVDRGQARAGVLDGEHDGAVGARHDPDLDLHPVVGVREDVVDQHVDDVGQVRGVEPGAQRPVGQGEAQGAAAGPRRGRTRTPPAPPRPAPRRRRSARSGRRATGAGRRARSRRRCARAGSRGRAAARRRRGPRRTRCRASAPSRACAAGATGPPPRRARRTSSCRTRPASRLSATATATTSGGPSSGTSVSSGPSRISSAAAASWCSGAVIRRDIRSAATTAATSTSRPRPPTIATARRTSRSRASPSISVRATSEPVRRRRVDDGGMPGTGPRAASPACLLHDRVVGGRAEAGHAVRPVQRHPAGSLVADQPRDLAAARGIARDGEQQLRLGGRRGDGAVLGQRPQEEPEGHDEGQHHGRGDPGDEERQAPAHGRGGASGPGGRGEPHPDTARAVQVPRAPRRSRRACAAATTGGRRPCGRRRRTAGARPRRAGRACSRPRRPAGPARAAGRTPCGRAPARGPRAWRVRVRASTTSSPTVIGPSARGDPLRRSTARIRASSWSAPNGLVTKSSAPASSALTMSASSSRAVTTITGTSLTDRIIVSTWTPSTSGSPRSRRTTSGRSSITLWSPGRPAGCQCTA